MGSQTSGSIFPGIQKTVAIAINNPKSESLKMRLPSIMGQEFMLCFSTGYAVQFVFPFPWLEMR